jgi:hypothetical protein
MSSDSPIKLRIPRQDLPTFDLFRPDAEAAGEWARSLPATNTRSVAHQLLYAVGELNRVRLTPEVRYGIMEALRPALNVSLSGLSRRFINQPLIMPEEPRQMAELSDWLYSICTTAYTIVAIEALRQRESVRHINPARLVCQAIERALGFAGGKILQTFQLYRPVEQGGWLALHQLYALAERQKLGALPVEDTLSTGTGTTITTTYFQGLLLGCCKPNQLRQSDLTAIYRGLREWSALVEMSPAEGGEGLFLVDLESDQPPLYNALLEGPPGPNFRAIDTASLISHLQTLQREDDQRGKTGIAFDKNTRLPSNMLTHLIGALGSMSMRNFSRSVTDTRLLVGIGLSSTHYHMAGERTFQQLLFDDDYRPNAAERLPDNPFMIPRTKRDSWAQANPERDFLREEGNREPRNEAAMEHEVAVDPATLAALENDESGLPPADLYPVYRVRVINASPGGYCLEWSSELPGEIRAGDLVGAREESAAEWSIAVIRWVSHPEDDRTLVGLELLSPRAMPFGARIHQKRGTRTAPLRVLLLPEIKLVGQPHTLITPRAGFRERQKISLVRAGEEFFIQLLHQVAATGSFAQFDFRYIKRLGELLAEDRSGPVDSTFDSIWNKI